LCTQTSYYLAVIYNKMDLKIVLVSYSDSEREASFSLANCCLSTILLPL
jgi:hypothetical protein